MDVTTECRPPPEHEGEPYHWLGNEYGGDIPARWRPKIQEQPDGTFTDAWMVVGVERVLSIEHMTRHGWRWLAVARPPGETL